MKKAFYLSIISFVLLALTFLYASLKSDEDQVRVAPIILGVLSSFVLSIISLTMAISNRKELKSAKGITTAILNLTVISFFVAVSAYSIAQLPSNSSQPTSISQ
jgi:heme/copper-type cytochrome/quinol oxidase subunit 3